METENVLNTIAISEFLHYISWSYPIRIILEGPVLIISDDNLSNTEIYHKHCTVQSVSNKPGALTSRTYLDVFYMPSAFAVQFRLVFSEDIATAMRIMSLEDAENNEEYFSFGWNADKTTFIQFDGTQYNIEDDDIGTIAKGTFEFTIKVSSKQLQMWISNTKNGYKSFSLNATNDEPAIKTNVWSISSTSATSSDVSLEDVCVSDLPFEQFKTNRHKFDYNMRCWSGKYKNINRREEFISSFISDAGCSSIAPSCEMSLFGEDVDYIPYYDALVDASDENDPSCFAGKFTNPEIPTNHNALCVMLKKCDSPKQSLYTKSFGFSSVNVTTASCDDIVPNITRKISVEWQNEIELNYGTLQLSSEDVYTINSSFLIFQLRPIRFPAEGFDNRSIYISFMNLNDSSFTEAQSNLTWTFELNNEFGVKFYRGDRNETTRLIKTQYVENILESQTENDVRGYCFADDFVTVYYASDGENFKQLTNVSNGLENLIEFILEDVSFVSKLHFKVRNSERISGNYGGLICTIYVNGEQYSTSTNSAFWSIAKSTKGGTTIIEPTPYEGWSSISSSTPYISDEASWIWNYDCVSSVTDPAICANETIVFEFSFYYVDNPDNAPSFYVEWDATFGDYIRFGFYNKSNQGIAYNDNFNLLLETGYISNFYSYSYTGYHTKLYIQDVMFSIANDSYNQHWFVLINIVNTTDPKPCFGYDLLGDKQTRITARDLETFSLWRDDGRSMSWKLNGNIFTGWHTIKYLNTTENITYNRVELLPYYLHQPFVSNQESWQRSFSIDEDIMYDYMQIEFDIYTFCGWNHDTDNILVSLAFEEYLQFSTLWTSTHTRYDCEGYNAPTWNDVIDVVRMNNGTHSDISCYAKGMTSPSYECTLDIHTIQLIQNESFVPVTVDCESFGESNLTLYYSQDGESFDDAVFGRTTINNTFNGSTRDSLLRIDVNYYNKSVSGGLKCNITINNNTIYYTNTSEEYWSIINSSNDDNEVILQNIDGNDAEFGALWIWNGNNSNCNQSCPNSTYASFQFDFYFVFIQEYELEYVNKPKINISNNTNVTWISFAATPLTRCEVIFDADGNNITDITITDSAYISSDSDATLYNLTNTPLIDNIYIDLEPFSYHCRLDIFDGCYFNGTLLKLNETSYNIHISDNASSWRLYAERGYECLATFYDFVTNETFTINAEDGGMISEECDTWKISNTSVNMTVFDAHYGCYTHVKFHAPNTNSEAFVLRIEAEIEDISTKFGTYTKSWGFGNLTITPLVCSSFSHIVPLKTPITLSSHNTSIIFTDNELSSINYKYLFLLITFDTNDTNLTNVIEFDMLLGDSVYLDYYWDIIVTDTECSLINLKLESSVDCSANSVYYDFVHNVTNNMDKQQLIWMSWDPYHVEVNARNFSFGVGTKLHQNTLASLHIYGNLEFNAHSYLDYVQFNPPTDDIIITISPIQFALPKICLSQTDEFNRINLDDTWTDDCLEAGWELRKYAHIIDDEVFTDEHHNIDQCEIHNLNVNPITKLATDCFHGPFKGAEPNDYGDYISRFFYVFTDVNYDIIEVNLNYYGLCTWNPEQYENDTAYVFVNNKALWKSAPQYEFVSEYCEGYKMYSDWTLFTQYRDVLNPELIQCLYLLDQICAYPVSFTFRHTSKDSFFFSIGIGAKLNQHISNEAFGFSNVSLSYYTCPGIEALPIGNVTHQPLQNLNYKFKEGDMVIISSSSIYYLIAHSHNNGPCVFTLFGGYPMWSQESSNCTISGLPIMQYYLEKDYDDPFELGISDGGHMSLQLQNSDKHLWTRRTPCAIDTAYYYYSMNKTTSMVFADDVGLYSLDCKWAMIITRLGPIHFMKNVNLTTAEGETVHTLGSDVDEVEFDHNGSFVFHENGETTTISPAGGDFLIFDEGKLVVFDHDTDVILEQYDFNWAQCELPESIGFIKYFYFMKPEDILWNGEVLISKNCDYKLILHEGNLMIYNAANVENITLSTGGNAERLEFRKDGNLVLYSYADDSEILWETKTSTLLTQSIYYADRAILKDDGQFIVIDDATLTVSYKLKDESFTNDIKIDYNSHLDCSNSKYDFVDKRWGFYATWISYYNCENNKYTINETTPCVAHKYCPIVQHYEYVFLQPTASQTNCRKYTWDYWRNIANDYVLFQLSAANTQILLKPKLYLVLSTSNDIIFGEEFDESYLKYRTLLVTISPRDKNITLTTKQNTKTIHIPSLFYYAERIEWLWIEWNVNFDSIAIGNSKFLNLEPIFTAKYSDFFSEKLKHNEYLFSYLNVAWNAYTNKCYGSLVVQFPPLNIEVAKGCYGNATEEYEKPERTIVLPPTPPTWSSSILTTHEPTIATTATLTTINATIIATNIESSIVATDEKTFDKRKDTISIEGVAVIIIAFLALVVLISVVVLCVKRKNKKENHENHNEDDEKADIEMPPTQSATIAEETVIDEDDEEKNTEL